MIKRNIIKATPGRPKGFLRREDGGALVELALVLPMMLVIFAVIVEGSRMLWAYQTTIVGVREATRYLSRITPQNICVTNGSVTGTTSTLTAIITQSASGGSLFPIDVTVNSVTPSYSCDSGDYRNSPIAIGQVSASITIDFPFGGLFKLVGSQPAAVQTVVSDQARIYGS